MTKGLYTITEHILIANAVWRMTLSGDTASLKKPGQFVNIELPSFYLRRPFSVMDWDRNGLTVIYKVVGAGTEYMSRMAVGEKLDLLVGLGNGFDTCKGLKPLIIGGGVGTPPLYGVAKALAERGAVPDAALGFALHKDAMLIDELKALGVRVHTAFMSDGKPVTGLLSELADRCDYYYACGSEAMLRAVFASCRLSGQLSLEARMSCGFGACMGCTCLTLAGGKRVCADGPVFYKEELTW